MFRCVIVSAKNESLNDLMPQRHLSGGEMPATCAKSTRLHFMAVWLLSFTSFFISEYKIVQCRYRSRAYLSLQMS